MKPQPQTLGEMFEEKVNLAETYAQDGALISAARVLRELAYVLESEHLACVAELQDVS